MRQQILAGIVLGLSAITSIAEPITGQGTWETTLQGRLPLTPGGTDYQAYYDTALNITWLADAGHAVTSGYDNDGLMTWDEAQAWVAALGAANHLGYSDWRLPRFTGSVPPDLFSNYGWWRVRWWGNDPTVSELVHLHYVTLGSGNAYDIDEICGWILPSYCLTNTGPFSNMGYEYWTGTQVVADGQVFDDAWYFRFTSGWQEFGFGNTDGVHYSNAWAVRDGDISAVPLPAVGWLLAPALGLIGWKKAKRSGAACANLSRAA